MGERLKAARESRNLSLEDAAEKLGITAEELEKYEGGEKPAVELLLKMAELYGKSATELEWGEDVKKEVSTMFPKNADPAPSLLADWRVLVGALLMLLGVGGVMLFVMKAVGEGYDTVSALLDYGGASVVAFAALFLLGLGFCVVTAIIKNKNNKSGRKNGKSKS